ncbi:MAG TPA: hypothetical protein DCX95_04005 [Elusimicrobia bacterium]|nr:hypothetical protein [Elusimicrobiota bacterium]
MKPNILEKFRNFIKSRQIGKIFIITIMFILLGIGLRRTYLRILQFQTGKQISIIQLNWASWIVIIAVCFGIIYHLLTFKKFQMFNKNKHFFFMILLLYVSVFLIIISDLVSSYFLFFAVEILLMLMIIGIIYIIVKKKIFDADANDKK